MKGSINRPSQLSSQHQEPNCQREKDSSSCNKDRLEEAQIIKRQPHLHHSLKTDLFGKMRATNAFKRAQKDEYFSESNSTKASIEEGTQRNLQLSSFTKEKEDFNQGQGTKLQTNLSKFIDYFIEFKLQIKGGYVPRKREKITLVQLKQKWIQKAKIHTNYQCDGCSMEPIIGIRYHCGREECGDDYDLCQRCISTHEHNHILLPLPHNGLNHEALNRFDVRQ